jgi:hypothetical protein
MDTRAAMPRITDEIKSNNLEKFLLLSRQAILISHFTSMELG